MTFDLPPGYASDAALMADIDLMHSQGKVVLLSLGGQSGPIRLDNTTQQQTFQTSVTSILTRFGNKIDGLDIDIEGDSWNFPTTWTMTSPAVAQTNMVNGIKNIMATYQATNGKKMLLTMAPEVLYTVGALDQSHIGTGYNLSAALPIIDGLRNELDLLDMQSYNVNDNFTAWNGQTYTDNGSPDLVLAMSETLIKGFTLLGGKGTFTGLPASKIGFGLPANSNGATAGSGFVAYTALCNAAKYFKGEISKPSGVTYTMSASYSDLRGFMTWDINADASTSYGFANAFACAFPPTSVAPVANFTFLPSTGCSGQTVTFTDASTNTPTAWAWNFGANATPATATTQGPHTVTYSTTGTKTVTLKATNAIGNNTSTQSVVINTVTSAPGTITGSATACQGVSKTYSITAVSGATGYIWTLPNGWTGTSTTTSITATTGAASGNVSVVATNACGSSASSSTPVTISGSVVAPGTISGATAPCQGSTSNYTIQAVTGATSYTWSLPNGWTGTSTTTSISAVPTSAAGNVTVAANSSCGTSAAATLAVTPSTAPAQPGAFTTSSPSVCPSSTGIVYTVPAVTGATSYIWAYSGTGATINGTGNSVTVDYNAATAGTLSVSAKNSCGTSTGQTLSVSMITALNVTGASRCGNGAVTLTVNSTGGPYSWYANTSGGSAVATGTTYSPTLSATTTYYVESAAAVTGQVGMTSSPANVYQVYDYTTGTRKFDVTANTMNFTTAKSNVTINSVDIYTGSSTSAYLSNFWVTIENASGTVLFTSPKYSIASGNTARFKTVPISTLLPAAGSYKMRIYSDLQADGWGSISTGQTLPVTDASNTVTLSSGYSAFTNVTFQTGSTAPTCGRTPVTGTVNATVVPTVTITNPNNTICAGVNTTFTSAITNGGTNPTYQWTKNGQVITGEAGTTYSSSVLQTNDIIKAVLTSNAACTNPATVTSSGITMIVNPAVVPTVSITNPNNTVCAGVNTTFTSAITNGGTNPTYQWTKNGQVITGEAGTTYSSSALQTNDVIKAVLTSNAACTNPATVTSSGITMTVNPAVVPTVTITNPNNTVCAGVNTTFTSAITNGGTNPTYQWTKNGQVITGEAGTTYSSSFLQTNDIIKAVLTSNAACTNPATVTNSGITMTVNPAVVPTVTITNPNTTVCAGVNTTFTSAITNGGANPTYQWTKNGQVITGEAGTTYSSSVLQTNDIIKAVLTSNAACTNPATVTSSGITMTVNPTVVPTVSITNPNNTVCAGVNTTFTSAITNGGANPTYQWTKNGQTITGATGTTYSSSVLQTNDIIKAVLTSNAACTNPATVTSSGITMTVNTKPAAPGTITGSNSVNNGQSNVAYAVTPANNTSYVWTYSGNGATVSGTTASSNIDFSSNATSGTLTVFAQNTCGTSVNSSQLAITVNTVVTSVNDELNTRTGIIVSPNPVASHTVVEISNLSLADESSIEIYDQTGQIVYNSTNKSESKVQIHLPLSAGVYIVAVKSGSGNFRQKLIIF